MDMAESSDSHQCNKVITHSVYLWLYLSEGQGIHLDLLQASDGR